MNGRSESVISDAELRRAAEVTDVTPEFSRMLRDVADATVQAFLAGSAGRLVRFHDNKNEQDRWFLVDNIDTFAAHDDGLSTTIVSRGRSYVVLESLQHVLKTIAGI